MVKFREIIRLRALGVSQSNTAHSCGCARSTVELVEKKAIAAGLKWPLPEEMTDEAIKEILYPPKKSQSNKYPIDHEEVERNLRKPDYTLALCWGIYCEEASDNDAEPYQYSAFCKLHRKWQDKHNIAMHQQYICGDMLEVDWSGRGCTYVDPDTSKTCKAYVFVACLPWSQYIFAKAYMDMKETSWIQAHVDAFNFYRGVPRIIVPDNCKTAVIKNTKDKLVLNEQYRRMAEYYGCCIIPCAPRSPRQKNSVEASVGLVERQVLAPLSNEVFLSLSELNLAIASKVDEINSRPFQKREGSRESEFFCQERDALLPLPTRPYTVVTTKLATVQFNYHISFDGMNYSCPFNLLREQVEVRATDKAVEIYYKGTRVAIHPRLYGHKGQYHTIIDHMPESHRDYAEWNGDRFRRWGASISEPVEEVIDRLLRARSVEQQAYKPCRAILQLGKKYGNDVLSEACRQALSYSKSTTYTTVKNLAAKIVAQRKQKVDPDDQAYLRGADYFDED